MPDREGEKGVNGMTEKQLTADDLITYSTVTVGQCLADLIDEGIPRDLALAGLLNAARRAACAECGDQLRKDAKNELTNATHSVFVGGEPDSR